MLTHAFHLRVIEFHVLVWPAGVSLWPEFINGFAPMLVGPLLAGAGGVWAAAGMTPANAIAAMNDTPATAVEALTARLFAMIGINGCHIILPEQLLVHLQGFSIPDIEGAAECCQFLLHTGECPVNKLHPTVILIFQRIQDIRIKNKNGKYRLSGL